MAKPTRSTSKRKRPAGAPKKNAVKRAAAKTAKVDKAVKVAKAAKAKHPTSKRPTSTARRTPAASKSRGGVRRPATRKTTRPPQTFIASHLHATAFDEGLRAYAQYRDLGISKASGGMVQAHVIRFVPPCRPEEVSKLHFHDVEFQMIYVLKGWIKSEFEGEGTHTFAVGSCWVQPPRIRHKVLDYSDDCEVLEIIMPAEFETVTLD